jgi:hypothetical protein
MLEIRKGGSIAVRGSTAAPEGLGSSGGRVRVWLRGRTFRGGSLLVGGTRLALPRELNGPNQWIDLGTVTVAGGQIPPISLERPKRSLRPGDAQADHVGPVELVADADPTIVRVKSSDYRELCGVALDWVDVLRR